MPRNQDENDVRGGRPRDRVRKDMPGDLGVPDSPVPSQAAPSQYGYSTDLGKYGDPNYTYQEGDEMTNPGPEPPEDSPEWPAWKAHAKAWRRHIGQRQAWVDAQLASGASLEDLGIRDVKEEGQAGYRRRALMGDQGMLNTGWQYDWASGRKRNMVTKDESARDRWYPITPEDIKERDYARSYGGGVQGYTNRLQSETRNRFSNVMNEGGQATPRNEYGIYEDKRPDGSTNYYDEYGALTDRTGRRTGGSYFYDGRGTNIVNRVAAEGTEYGGASSNGVAANPTLSTAWGGYSQPRAANQTPTGPTARPTPTPTPAPRPSSMTDPNRVQYGAQGQSGWGGYYNYSRPQYDRQQQANRGLYGRPSGTVGGMSRGGF